MGLEPRIHDVFERNTGTWQYIVADPQTRSAVIIDPVLDFNPSSNALTSQSADGLLDIVRENGYKMEMILETHVHADHITASKYLQRKLEASQGTKPPIGIGKRVTAVQERFGKRYGIPESEYKGAFDKLFEDDETFNIGELKAKVLHLPGHTPDHIGYEIGSNVFCGDSLFNHDVGSARCDFPGGSASTLYSSVRKLLSLPDDYKIWTGHDYPPGRDAGRTEAVPSETVEHQNRENKHLKKGVAEDEFIKWREERDSTLGEPRLLHQSLQFNIRAGELPAESNAGDRLIHTPLKLQGLKL